MIERALATSFTEAWLVLVTAASMTLATIVYTRIAGLRSFSKMSSFDFVVTIAIGSAVGAVAVSLDSSLANGVIALGGLFGTQLIIALLRRYAGLSRLVDNTPVLLMAGGRMLEDNMKRERVTDDDILSKLREANVLNYLQVRAVVLETTGDISVLHGDGELDPDLLAGVRDADRLE